MNAILEQSTHYLTARKEDLAREDREDSFSDHTQEEEEAEDDDASENESEGSAAGDRSRSMSQRRSTSAVGTSTARSTRRKTSRRSSTATADPDANDIEFEEGDDETRDVDDEDFAREMEEEDQEIAAAEESDEDQGLVEDADLPIEELLKKYGYPAPGESAPSLGTSTAPTPAASSPSTPAALPDDQSMQIDMKDPSKSEDRAASATAQDAKGEVDQPKDDDQAMSDAESQASDAAEEHIKVKAPFLLRGTLRP